MSMIFYAYEVPTSSTLFYEHGVEFVFIAYNPMDGETAFFDTTDDLAVPFNAGAMAFVEERWQQYTRTNHGPEGFDRQGHEDFMRSL
jgi:hypothetical protein